MSPLNRRDFLKTGTASAALGIAHEMQLAVGGADPKTAPQEVVSFLYDGVPLTPAEYGKLLATLATSNRAQSDRYLSGGSVQALEQAFVKLLGKESAVFVPTGTLANHLALRLLTAGATRVLVPGESHVYNDANDCVQTLSHLNLVPLGMNQATFTLAEVQDAVNRATNGPFPLRVGAIAIESPVNRRRGEMFDYPEMQKISAFTREHAIKMHLDGVRLFVASAYTGIAPADYARLFDTVYISLYKCFNAGTGAILAGPKAVIDKVGHERKVFGGGLFQAWPYAAVALSYLDGFVERFRKAIRVADELFQRLQADGRMRIESVPRGTNVYTLRVEGVNPKKYRAALQQDEIRIRRLGKDGNVSLVVNESLNRRSAAELAKSFLGALVASK